MGDIWIATVIGAVLLAAIVVLDLSLAKLRKAKADNHELEVMIDNANSTIGSMRGEIDLLKQQDHTVTKYVAIEPFKENDGSYIRFLAQMATRPEWIWFITQSEQKSLNILKDAKDLEVQRRAAAWIEAHDLINAQLAKIVQKYNIMTTEPEDPEDIDGEISLS